MSVVVFEFSRDWINAGAHGAPGDRIDLPEGQALRLRGLGAGQIVDPPTDPDESPEPSPRPRKRR
jgi:hypothetical protein